MKIVIQSPYWPVVKSNLPSSVSEGTPVPSVIWQVLGIWVSGLTLIPAVFFFEVIWLFWAIRFALVLLLISWVSNRVWICWSFSCICLSFSYKDCFSSLTWLFSSDISVSMASTDLSSDCALPNTGTDCWLLMNYNNWAFGYLKYSRLILKTKQSVASTRSKIISSSPIFFRS